TLRQEEEKVWVRALEAKKNWDCTDSRRLFKTLNEKASFYKRQASTEFKRLGDCGELITEDNPDLLLQHAKTDYKSKNFRSAREQAWRIVGLKNSLGEQARALLKDIEEVEVVNDLLSRYDLTFRAGRASDACNILLNIEETHPAFPNMDDVKRKVKDQCSALP